MKLSCGTTNSKAWKVQSQSSLSCGCHDDKMTDFKKVTFLSWGIKKKENKKAGDFLREGHYSLMEV